MKKLLCPKCLIELSEVNYGTIHLAACTRCSGNFLSRALMKQAEHYRFGNFFGVRTVHSGEPPMNCPSCGVKMEKTKLPGKNKGLLDVCRGCESFWFEKGELDAFLVLKRPRREPEWWQHVAALTLFFTMLPGLHFLLYFFFKNHLHAALFSGSFGPVLFYWLLRVVIYGKIQTQFGDADV